MKKNTLKKMVRTEFLKLTGTIVKNKNITIICESGTFDKESLHEQLERQVQYSFECWKKMHGNWGAYDMLKGVDLSFEAFKCSDMFRRLCYIEVR